jgi:ubiquinone/menaquinone biosynthesis C-methylase UbiE
MQLKKRLITRLKASLAYRLGLVDAGHRVENVYAGEVGTHNESARIAWLEEALTQVPAGARILDAGAGERRFETFCGHLNYVAQDFGQYDGKGNQAGLQMGSWDQTKLDIISDITDIPEPDSSFDAIMCVEVFEHLPSPLLALKEFSRLLRSGGDLIITAPFCSLTHFAPYHFYTGFNQYFYKTHLPANGFEIVELRENGNFFEYLAQEIRRIPSMAELYAKDRPDQMEDEASKITLNMLERLSREGQSSAELLHFGYHVRARKNSE